MCIVLFQWQPTHPHAPLIMAANRDEFHHRPAQAAQWRGDLFCGLDLQAGGTWLGVHRDGRMAVITNYREPIAGNGHGARSRGDLPLDFLNGNQDPQTFCHQVAEQGHHYGGFNLLIGNRQELWYVGNRGAEPQAVAAGIHGLCNGLLDDPWPKVTRGTSRLRSLLDEQPMPTPDQLIGVVNDRYQPPEESLPDTGVGPLLEKLVAPIFIQSEQYGTRASSAVVIKHQGQPIMHETRWHPNGTMSGSSCNESAATDD